MNLVKETREALGYDKRRMAKEMGCSYATERRLEDGAALPTNAAVLANLRRLAKKAGIEIDLTK